ncbi:MAG: DUF1684 domain-containing protein [Chloroflexi bacterium]|nr:MAG: DUF1684 domain-containing protein [Chloroflexota bacterium]
MFTIGLKEGMAGAMDAYEESILAERRRREEMLLEDRSWLTLAGLYWLQPGENRFGQSPENDIVLPGDETPARAGSFYLEDEQTTLAVAPGVSITHNGQTVTHLVMKPDSTGEPDFIELGDLTMVLLQRGQRFGIRLWDKASPVRQAFTRLRWYPIHPEYRITAQFVAYDPPRLLPIADVLGDETLRPSPGYVHFIWQGQECRLEAEARGDRLFFNFRDLTNDDTTYGAGRFLYAEPPAGGIAILDFNLATNPYCAYTDYATCPLPPAQNRLPVRIEAGEMRFPAAGEI